MRIFSLVALSASVLFLLINSTFAGNQTKVGFVYLTTPGDHGWTCLLYTSDAADEP